MNLKQEQEQFVEFIKNNYNVNCDITTEFLDLDKFKSDITLFIGFDNINFELSKYDDDCMNYGKLNVSCYLVVRNDTPSNLNNKLLESTDEFYKLIENENYIDLKNIEFFNYVSGNKYIVATEFTLGLLIKL